MEDWGDSEEHGAIGALAANRPLLVTVIFAFGLTALSVVGFMRAPGAGANGLSVADFATNALIAFAAPNFAAAAAPRRPLQRALFAALVLAALIGAYVAAERYGVPAFFGAAVRSESIAIGAAFFVWSLASRPLTGALTMLSVAGPFAAIVGAIGAAALLSLEQIHAPDALGAVATMSVAFACLIGIGVAADFAFAFARGADSHAAAGIAAHRAAAPSMNAALNVICIFSAGLLPAAETLDWSWRMILFAAGGGVVAVTTALFLSAATLSLSTITEEVAAIENHRRQRFRRWWRPIGQILPMSSAFAFVAILAILSIVAQFETYAPISVIKASLIVAAALSAALTYVSARTGLFVMLALYFAMTLVDWGYAAIGIDPPSLLAQLTAIACLAALFGQIAVAWRDARSPRRKAHQATEEAMIDGAFRYAASVAFTIAALAIASVSGLWADGASAAGYYAALAATGGVAAAPIMTAIGGVFGRD